MVAYDGNEVDDMTGGDRPEEQDAVAILTDLVEHYREAIAEGKNEAQAAGITAIILRAVRDAIEDRYLGVQDIPPAWMSPRHHWSEVAHMCNLAVFLLYPLFEEELDQRPSLDTPPE